MTISETIGDLYNLPWAASYSGTQPVRPGPAAIIMAVDMVDGGIRITAQDQWNTYSTIAGNKDSSTFQSIFSVLVKATGKTLSDANEFLI